MCVCANAEDPARKRIFSAFGAWLKAGFYASWTPIRSHADSRISTGTAQHGVRRNSPRLFLSLTWLLLPCWLLPYCSLWFQKGQNSVWKRFLSKSVLLQGTCTHSEFRPRSTWHIQNATILGNLVNVILAFAHQTDSVLLWGLHGQKKIRARSYTPGEFSCCLWYIFQKWMLCSPFCMWLHVGLPWRPLPLGKRCRSEQIPRHTALWKEWCLDWPLLQLQSIVAKSLQDLYRGSNIP